MVIPEHIEIEARVLRMRLHNCTELGQATQLLAEALFTAERRGSPAMRSASLELATLNQEWADMHYEIARNCLDPETQTVAAENSLKARRYLFALIGNGSVEE